MDGKTYVSDQATIWRWRTAFQHDFAARMDWSVKPPAAANHNPDVVVNGQQGTAPLEITTRVGERVTLDATGTRDRDGNVLRYTWFFYPEAGMGIPGRPVLLSMRDAFVGGFPRANPPAGAGGIPSAPPSGLPQLRPRVTIENANAQRATVTAEVAGVAHVILAVEDNGSPRLTSYRRVILTIKPAPSAAK